MSLADHTFGLLLRHATPMIVAGPGSLPPNGTQLRGVVRSGANRARVCYSGDSHMDRGWGYEFDLTVGDTALDVNAAIDWIRAVATSGVREDCATLEEDSHCNKVVSARDAGFGAPHGVTWYDQNLFSILSILVHGGGHPWFEDLYTSAGFMLMGGQRCRLYIQPTAGNQLYGLDLPLADEDGHIIPGQGGSFPQELASILRTGSLSVQPVLSEPDDYATAVYDMSQWA